MTPQFNKLKVKDVRRETADAVSVTFDIPADLAPHYKFSPGGYLTLQHTIEGDDVRRCYSISSGLDDGEVRVAIKKVANGRFSNFANDELKPGMELEVMTPMGGFMGPIEPERAKNYLGFAAGSGITPIMSIMRTILLREPNSTFTLFYGNRDTNSIIFRESLDDLKDLFLERLSVFHILSREATDVALFSGRLDVEKLREFAGVFFDPNTVDHAFLCGPGEMISGLKSIMVNLGLPENKIHEERFTPSEDDRALSKSNIRAVPVEGGAEIVAVLDGTARQFKMDGSDASIIDAAHRNGIELPFSCKGGMCCTCRAKLVEGDVSMTLNYSLEPWEIEAGFVLTCQSRPTTSKVVVDFDHL